MASFREKGEGVTGWGQKGDLYNGDVLFLILVVVSYLGMFTLRKVTELNAYDSHTFCMFIIHNKFITKSCNDPAPRPTESSPNSLGPLHGQHSFQAFSLAVPPVCVHFTHSGFLQLPDKDSMSGSWMTNVVFR